MKRTVLVLASAGALVAAGTGVGAARSWFSQTFRDFAEGASFTDKSGGNTGGTWATIAEGVATVAAVDGRKGIAVDTTGNAGDEIAFTASAASTQDVEQFDFSVCTKPMLQDLPDLAADDKGALAVRSDDDGATLFFAGYTAAGWTNLHWNGFSGRTDAWLDCRATFDYSDANTAYVTYWAKGANGTYAPLADAQGNSCFVARSNERVRTIAFCGSGTVGDFTGSDETPVEHLWTGLGGDNQWSNPANWSGGEVPGDGENATAGADARIAYGSSRIIISEEGPAVLSIVTNDNIRIVRGTVELEEARNFGRVIVDSGATLVANGTFGALELGYASTLKVTPGEELPGPAPEVLDRAVCVDGVKIDLDSKPAATAEGVGALVGPYGSVGTPLALTAKGQPLEDWSSAWYGKVDGRMGLWLVNGAYDDKVAIWNDGAAGNLADKNNWSGATIGPNVAAEMGNGQAHVNEGNAFRFARRFEVGKGGTGEVNMSNGEISGDAILVGTQGGAGIVEIVNGTITACDSLWRHAIATGTDATGTLHVFGGTVTAKGDLSIGDAGTGAMTLERGGTVKVGGSLAVGCEGSLKVSGGALTVGGSAYVGRSTGEVYSVTMAVAGGAVTNEDAGVFMVGSYGGPGSSAKVELTDGEIKAGGAFVCGGYRSAAVNVLGGTLKAKEIALGSHLIDERDYALLTVTAGRIETDGFTSGTNGTLQLTLAGGEIAATAANDDFFKGIACVDMRDMSTIDCGHSVTSRTALIGAGGITKRGAGTFTVGGYAAWAGKTVVEEGVLDMDGGMVQETEIASGARLDNAKRDDIDQKSFISEPWTSGTESTKPYVRISFRMTTGEDKVAVATAANGVTNGAFRIRSVGEGWVFSGWTAFGWTDLGFADGTSVAAGTYDVQMMFDFSVGKPYAFYYVKRGDTYGRLVSADKLTAFPVTLGLASVLNFTGVTMTQGEQLSVDTTRELYWKRDVASGDWNNPDNWVTKEGAAAGKYPTAGYSATFENEAQVTLADDSSVDSLVANAPVKLVQGRLQVGKGLGGGGVLVLKNVTIDCGDTAGVISLPVEIEEGSASSVSGRNMTFSGALRGSGVVALQMRLEGDTSAFAGRVSSFDGTLAAEAAAHNELSAWQVECFPFVLEDMPIAFGALSGTMEAGDDDVKNAVVLVGARDEDCTLAGNWASGGVSGLKWMAATSSLTYSMANTSFLELLGGGTVALAEEAGVPTSYVTFANRGGELVEQHGVTADISGLLKNSSAPVVYHDDGADRAWANAFAASNTGGFVKRGSGTLTWRKASEAAADVTVEQGTLVVPAGTVIGFVTLGENARLVVDLADVEIGSVVFSASGANRKLEEPYLRFVNEPAGFTYNVIKGPNNSIVIVSGSREYVWTGAGEDEKWSNVTNWSVTGELEVPDRTPRGYDVVSFVSDTCTTVRLDGVAAAAKITGRGDVVFVGAHELSVGLSVVLENGCIGLDENATLNVGSELDVRSVFGFGTVSVQEGALVVSPVADESDRFAGMLAVTNLTKRGNGVFTYRPSSSLSGVLVIDQGTFVWDCAGVADQGDAAVTMAAGATLDLNGNTVAVKSFAGAGTVTNGVLRTVDNTIVQRGGALTVPAVAGMTYVASRAGETLCIMAKDKGTSVKVKLPKSWFAAGVSGRRAIYCDGHVEWDIARPGVEARYEGDGWWTIPCGGFAVRLQ